MTNFNYFYELMHANIDGLQIHPLNTDKSLPILTSPKDKNIPTIGTKIRDYFYIQNNVSLIHGTQNNPKAPSQKVDADRRFQLDENCQYDGPDRIMGVMSVSALGNVKQAIGDLLIKLEGDAHQIKYKPTQCKNSKAEKMFPGVLAGLCSEDIMRSIWHSLKNCEKTLCNAKIFLIKANMDWYQLPLPVMNGYFKQLPLPSQLAIWKVAIICSTNSQNLRKMVARFLSSNMTPSTTAAWHPSETSSLIREIWQTFLESGLKYKSFHLQENANPTLSQSNVGIANTMSIIAPKFDTFSTPVILAMTDGSCPPRGVSTLRQKYFDLKSSDNGTIIHGVFVCIESASRGPSVDTTYMVSNKEAKSTLTKITHCLSAWWYWHWVKKGLYPRHHLNSLSAMDGRDHPLKN